MRYRLICQNVLVCIFLHSNEIRSYTGTSSKKSSSSHKSYYHDSYDDGDNDIYEEDDYDWDRYHEDDDYAEGVDDAIDDMDWFIIQMG